MWLGPRQVLFGTDSHTCNAGAFGQFATGIGNTDASFVMGTGKLLIKSPATMQFALNGEMPDHLLAKAREPSIFDPGPSVACLRRVGLGVRGRPDSRSGRVGVRWRCGVVT